MSEVHEYKPGTPCWVDLITSNTDGAKQFYTDFFGWGIDDIPIEDGSYYTKLQIDGKDVTALYALNEEQKSNGIPPHWMSYISVEDADATTEMARSLGGKVLMEPMSVQDHGRMAVLEDPAGAAFSIWQPQGHFGAQLVNQPGTLCWNELGTRNTEACSQFYAKLFSWKPEVQQMEFMSYTVFMNEDRPIAGMYQITEDMGDVPPSWLVYFAVDDCDINIERAKTIGAEVKMPPTDIPEVGRFAVLQDPQGAVFSIIKLVDTPTT